MNIISRFFLYFFGTLTLKLNGEYCERLLNVMASNHVSFWKPMRKKDDFYITVLRKDIKKIRTLRRNTGVRIKIIKRSGFPLVLNKYKRRYGLILGVIIFVAAINFLSGRMWIIKVNGNINVTDGEINAFFENCGIGRGVAMSSINSDILKQQLILSFENIAWASVNKQGSVIEVNITEFTQEAQNEIPCNIVSQYDAVIKSVNVRKGSVNVKIGDTVSKNQILVSGIVGYGAGNSFVHSSGEIIAEIRFREKIIIDKVQEHSAPTGRILKRNALDIMGIKVPLYLGGVNGDFDLKKSYKYVNILGGEIPIIMYETKYSFLNRTYTEISNAEAQAISKDKLMSELKEGGATDINAVIYSASENEEQYVFEYNVICLMDVGKEAPIQFE